MKIENPTQILEKFIQIRQFDFKRIVFSSGWLHAFSPDEYPDVSERDRFGYYDDAEYLEKDIPEGFKEFILLTLDDVDPSDDNRYVPTLIRWLVLSGMKYDDIENTKNILSEYHALEQEHGPLVSDTYESYQTPRHQGRKERPVYRDPLKVAKNERNLESFMASYHNRMERASFIETHDTPKDVLSEAVIHSSDKLFIYRGSFKGDDAYIAELRNGARYYMTPQYRWRTDRIIFENENYSPCLPDRFFRDYPEVAEVIAPVYQELFEKGEYSLVLSFANVIQKAGIPFPLEKGTMAAAFERKYNQIRADIERSLSDSEPSQKGYSRYSGPQYAHLYYNLEMDLRVLSQFPQESRLIKPETVRDIFSDSLRAEAYGSARLVLRFINQRKDWREAIGAVDIYPALQGGAKDQSKWEFLSDTLGLLTKTPSWRDGREAEFLPEVIDYCVENKDWKRLNPILWYATRADDPVSAMWRDAIPKEQREKIRSNSTHNLYGYYYIDALMNRMDILDKGGRPPASNLKEALLRETNNAHVFEYV